MDERIAAIAAVLAAGYGTKRSESIVKCFPSFTAYVSAQKKDFVPEFFSPEDVRALSCPDIKEAERILKLCEAKNITVIPYFDDAFPERLRDIPEPPLVLYTAGKPLPDLNRTPSISMVGTRDAKRQYLKFAAMNGFSLAVLGFTVVSGVAYGIDTFCLKGALFAAGKAVAVLPCGVDMFPGRCDPNLISVLNKHGTLVSEYPPETPVKVWRYSKRNRILSGLTQSTLVVEAGISSGALSTAEYAFEQGRTVYAVPDEPYDPRSEGGNFLIRNGGVLASSFIDIVDDYNKKYGYGIDPALYREQLSKGFNAKPSIVVPNESLISPEPEKKKTASSKKKTDAPASGKKEIAETPRSEHPPGQISLEGNEAAVYEFVKSRPATADDICENLSLGFIEAIDLLATLSDKELVKEGAGGVYTVL